MVVCILLEDYLLTLSHMQLNFSPALSFFVIECHRVGKYFYSVGINSSGLQKYVKPSRQSIFLLRIQLFLNKAKLKD